MLPSVSILKRLRRYIRSLGCWLACLGVFFFWNAPAAYAGLITAGPTGLSGVSTIGQGGETVIYSVQIQKTVNPEGLSRIGVVIQDLSTPTGIVSTDFASLSLYRSTDAILDAGDTQLVTLGPGSINIGGETNLNALYTIPGAIGTTYYYLVTVVMSPTAVYGHAFKVGALANNIDMDQTPPVNNGGANQVLDGFLASSDNNRLVLFAGGHVLPTTPIPVGMEWVAGLLFLGYGIYRLLGRRGKAAV